MDTSLHTQPNKPTFGTTDFAGSPVKLSEYIDAKAEETCPAESGPMSGRDTKSQSAASLEVMDQLKALAQNVTQNKHASSDQDVSHVQSDMSEDAGSRDAGESQAPEPSISVFPRPTGFENNQVSDRRKSGKVLTLAGFAAAALIGAGGTIAWQAHFNADDAATAAAPAPVVTAFTVPPYLGRQLEELAQDVSAVSRRIEELAAKQQQLAAAQKQLDQLAAKQQQLAAKQEQVGQSISKLQTLEQARQRTPAPVHSRAIPISPRPSPPPPTPVEQTMPPPPPPPPPRTASHPIPPLPVPQ